MAIHFIFTLCDSHTYIVLQHQIYIHFTRVNLPHLALAKCSLVEFLPDTIASLEGKSPFFYPMLDIACRSSASLRNNFQSWSLGVLECSYSRTETNMIRRHPHYSDKNGGSSAIRGLDTTLFPSS